MFRTFIFSLTILCIPLTLLRAQSYPNLSELTLEKIMKGQEWTGTWPTDVKWTADGSTVFFNWNPENELLPSTWAWVAGERVVHKPDPDESADMIPAGECDYSADRSRIVWARNGNLWYRSLSSGQGILLLDFPQDISSPRFLLNEEHISFVSGNNLYLLSLKDATIHALTDFREEDVPVSEEPYSNEQEKWLHREQMELFEVLRLRAEKRKMLKERNEELQPHEPRKIYTGKARLFDISLSPDEKYVVFLTFEREKEGKQVEMPEYVTESGFTSVNKIRKKVGYPSGAMKAGIYNLGSDSVSSCDLSGLPGIGEFPVFGEKQTWETKKEKTRKVYLSPPVWSPDGKYALINIRSADNKDRWITLLDPGASSLNSLDRQHDEAWIGGPGIGEYTDPGTLGWYAGGTNIFFQSEETGYSHLYMLNTETGNKKQLTAGRFEIYDPFLSNDKKTFYFISNEEDPRVRNFYRMPADGGIRTRMTAMTGNNEVSLSPDEKYMVIRYSSANEPWELYFKKTGSDKPAVQITHSTTEEFNAYNWRIPEYIHFKASDGTMVPARLYLPDPKVSKGAAVIFVHGAGYLQNAHKWWSHYYREYMFHNFLVDNGYTVLDADYRGSAGYGRDWRTAIYRHMGGKDLSDHIDGAAFLVREYGINKERVGIYGGSYGGFITLMAQFTSPGTFKAGAALRSVTDWAHYNHGYTSNILNTPFTDSLAYRRSSPIYFAEGLRGHLLMCHGMIDDNVHFQDIVRLTQRLIELRKDDWELAVYPLESHAFSEWTSWLDEYRRVYKLFDRTIGGGDQAP